MASNRLRIQFVEGSGEEETHPPNEPAPPASGVVEACPPTLRSARESEAPAAPVAAAAGPPRRKLVWVGDDGFSTPRISSWLVDRGFEVVVERNAEAAHERLRREHVEIGYVVLRVPVSGASLVIDPALSRLAATIRRCWPPIRVLFFAPLREHQLDALLRFLAGARQPAVIDSEVIVVAVAGTPPPPRGTGVARSTGRSRRWRSRLRVRRLRFRSRMHRARWLRAFWTVRAAWRRG